MLITVIAIAAAVSLLAACARGIYENADDWVDGGLLSALALIGTMAVFFGVGFAGIGIANAAFDHDDHYRTVPLVALRDGTGQSGTYVWGTGSSAASANYVFYYQDGPAKRLVNLDASTVLLFEDSLEPYAIQFTGCDLSVSWVAPCFNDGERFIELHVPAGSVVDRVDLDLNEG